MPEDLENAGVESAADDFDRAELRETETRVATDERPRLAVRLALRFGAVAVVAVAGVVGWLGYHVYQLHQAEQQGELFLRAGRQCALEVTTISHTEVDADIHRILDSSIGTFHEDIQRGSQPFVELVKRDQSTTAGTITEAGLQSVTGGSARVLIAVSVKTTTAVIPEEHVKSFRMRIDVKRVGDGVKISNVEFIG
jgi:Mce-associated membrane protein